MNKRGISRVVTTIILILLAIIAIAIVWYVFSYLSNVGGGQVSSIIAEVNIDGKIINFKIYSADNIFLL